MTTTLVNETDYTVWLIELRALMGANYGLDEQTIRLYGAPENWEDYYNEDYSPLEALEEDSEYWAEAA